MAPELRPAASRPDEPAVAGAHRADGASDLGGPAPAARHRGRVVERGGLVLPGGDPDREPLGLAVPAPAPDPAAGVGVLPQGAQYAPRVAQGPLPCLTVLPRRDRSWTPWQALCAALLKDAVRCATRPSKSDLRKRLELQRRDDQDWLEGCPAALDFDTVCHVLGWEPTAVRRALRRR